MTGDEFLEYLADIKTMTDDSGYTNASTSIENFINGIESADESETYDLQTDLVSALSEVEFVYDCLLKKAQAFANCASQCESGYDSLENIYETVISDLGTNSGECTTTVCIFLLIHFTSPSVT